ncbi:MAG: hypothetical protein H6678_05240 [Candidatus Delongbacteria bacterium]|nr:hypothetical protein [Candidatus Delongbacteria bacterium]
MKMRTALIPVLVLSLAAASLAIQREVSDAEMVGQSNQIVYGQVVSLTYDYSNPAWPVMTQVQVQVENQFKGQPVARTWFTFPGGVKGEMTMEVSDTPELKVGDEGYFFLYDKAGESLPWLYGWEYGAITIENGVAHSLSFATEGASGHELPASTIESRLNTLLNGEGH